MCIRDSPMPDDMAALMTGHGNPHKAILFDSSWQWQYNDAFYAVHDSLAHDLFTKGAGVLKDLPCRYTDNYRGGKQLSKELHDHTAGIDGVGPEALLLATTQWLGANPIGFRVGMSGCVTFPMAAALRCTHHYELDVKIASANASIALGKEMKEYTRGKLALTEESFPKPSQVSVRGAIHCRNHRSLVRVSHLSRVAVVAWFFVIDDSTTHHLG